MKKELKQALPILHPWHSIWAGDNIPQKVNSIIEIPQGSKAKYELDKETGLLRLDRILMTDLTYPAHYGFIPQTYCQDEDPLDIIIVCSQQLFPLSMVEATVIGALRMRDGDKQDDKILAIASSDPTLRHITNLTTFPSTLLEQIHYFFENYKKQEKKIVTIQAILNQQESYHLIEESIKLYKTIFK